MRDREMIVWDRQHPPKELDPAVAAWHREHPDGTLEDLVRDLDLWDKPGDEDAQRLAWYGLKRLRDPAALGGFPAMRGKTKAAGRLAGRCCPRYEPRACRFGSASLVTGEAGRRVRFHARPA